MRLTMKNGEQLEVQLSVLELENALAVDAIGATTVCITGETMDGRYRTVRIADVAVTRTLNDLKNRDKLPVDEDPPPLEMGT